MVAVVEEGGRVGEAAFVSFKKKPLEDGGRIKGGICTWPILERGLVICGESRRWRMILVSVFFEKKRKR